MSVRLRVVTVLLLVGLLGPGCSAGVSIAPPCITDSECGDGLVCFPDGCGDPTRGIAVEVTGGSTSGLFPQDFTVDVLGTTQDFELKGPLTLVGSFQREKTATVDPTLRSIYTDEVLVRATGESELLPGVQRTYQARFSQTDRGTYSMNVGQGLFTVTAFPTSVEVPPQTVPSLAVRQDASAIANFVFASVEGSITVSGRLLKRRVAGPPPVEFALTQDAMDLQAFDPLTGEPLSQRVEVSSGRTGSRGDFILVMSPKAATLAGIELVASARDAAAARVPTKRFVLTPPFPTALTLELGDFGEPIPAVPGQVFGSDGQPLSGATVVIEGRVAGGGLFRSKLATTAADGTFALELLPTDDTPFALYVFPAAGVDSALTRVAVKVVNAPGTPPALSPPTVRCESRVKVTGQVLLPDGTPAVMLAVRATEQGSSGRPLPLDDVEVLTDLDGRYDLRLDPGNWRVEFIPSGALPATSRMITVTAASPADAGLFEGQTFAPITLPRGRRVTGTVSSVMSGRGSTPLANAQVRFFRITRIEGKPSAVLLGTSITNNVGAYGVILPTREAPR